MLFNIASYIYIALLIFQSTKSAQSSSSSIAQVVRSGRFSYPIINSCVRLEIKDYVDIFNQLAAQVKWMDGQIETHKKDSFKERAKANIAELCIAWRSLYSLHSDLPDELIPTIKATNMALKDIFVARMGKCIELKMVAKGEMRRFLGRFVKNDKIEYDWQPKPKHLHFCMVKITSLLNAFQAKPYHNTPDHLEVLGDDCSVEAFKKEMPKMLLMISDIVHFLRMLNGHVDRLGIKWRQIPKVQQIDALVENLMDDIVDPVTMYDIDIWVRANRLVENYLDRIVNSKILSKDPDLLAFLEQFKFFRLNSVNDIY